VAVHYRESKKEAEETAALLGGAPLIQGDQAGEPERIVREASRALGGLDLLVLQRRAVRAGALDQLPGRSSRPCWTRTSSDPST